MRQMMKILSVWLMGCLALLLPFDESEGAREYDGLCAAIKMEIAQELALERIGFLATLRITNNEVDASITGFSARLTFENPSLSESDSRNDASDLFFVQPPEVVGVTDIDGTGIIFPGETAVITWFIIPEISAGGTTPDGIRYLVGAELGGAIYGNRIAPEILAVLPDNIWVRPEPQLDITYFQPRDVDGDDPFTTDVVETPVPFSLGVLVKNVGYGQANKVRVVSEQPRIKENILNALIIPQLIGARIDGSNFVPDATAAILRQVAIFISGTNVDVDPSGTFLTCDCDLVMAELGYMDVVVQTAGCPDGILLNELLIVLPGPALFNPSFESPPLPGPPS